jgi:hypothetical protein
MREAGLGVPVHGGRPMTLREIADAGGAPTSPLTVQVAGDHYKKLKIQPIEFIHANGIPFAEGSVIKYVTRWRDKGGIKDLEKARHFLDLLIELESKQHLSKT